jgi:hypothetical protein
VLLLVCGDRLPEGLGRPLHLLRRDGSPARVPRSSPPSAKLTSAAAVPTMCVTAGESEVPSRPKARSRGQNP